MLRGRCVATERRVVCAAGRRGALSAERGRRERSAAGGGRRRGCGRARAGALTRALGGSKGPRCSACSRRAAPCPTRTRSRCPRPSACWPPDPRYPVLRRRPCETSVLRSEAGQQRRSQRVRVRGRGDSVRGRGQQCARAARPWAGVGRARAGWGPPCSRSVLYSSQDDEFRIRTCGWRAVAGPRAASGVLLYSHYSKASDCATLP